MQRYYRKQRRRGKDPVEAPGWLNNELRRISLLHSNGTYDATTYLNTKNKILEEAFHDLTSPHLHTPTRTVTHNKIKAYTTRLHLSTSKRRLEFNDVDHLKPRSVSTGDLLIYKNPWKPTGALNIQRPIYKNPPCRKCVAHAARRLRTGDTFAKGVAKGVAKGDAERNCPHQPRKIITTVASSVRLNQLARAKPHSFWKEPTETTYKAISPPQNYYKRAPVFKSTVTASPWPILRQDQEEEGLSGASTSIVKITHPMLLYNAQKKYSLRMDYHLDTDKPMLDNMKLPPLDNIPDREYVRY